MVPRLFHKTPNAAQPMRKNNPPIGQRYGWNVVCHCFRNDLGVLTYKQYKDNHILITY